MRILFVSGTSIGGAARSTHALADVLTERGHVAATLMRKENAPGRSYVHRRLVNLRVKLRGHSAANLVDRVARRIGTHLYIDDAHSRRTSWLAVRPENALRHALAAISPDVLVVNSIDLMAWRQLRADAAARDLPVVLYIREETGLLHLSHSRVPPDAIIANAEGHAEGARELGYHAVVAPSVIEADECRVDSTRERVVLVNPVETHGVDVALALAAARPDIPFTFVESWPLDAPVRQALLEVLRGLPNVVLRDATPDVRNVFRDARILLAPYRYPGRARVIAEAHINGLPALASNSYGIVEAVGPGGVVLDPDGPIEDWISAMSRLWDDDNYYDEMSLAALECSARAEMQPEHIASVVEQVLSTVVSSSEASSRRDPVPPRALP